MPRLESIAVATAAAAGCLTWGSSFSLPGSAPSATTRTAGSQAVGQVQGAAPGAGAATAAIFPAAGLAMVAGAAVVARGRRRDQAQSAKVAVRAFESELGVQAPVGFWDPAGFCDDGDEAAFKRRRCVELKHGRISMYACIGYIVPEYFRWPGLLSPSEDISFTDVPNGLGAFSKVPIEGWLQIFAFIGFIETTGFTLKDRADFGWGKDPSMAGEPGNYGLGPIGAFNLIKKQDPESRKRSLNAELANSRLAMVAILGMLFQNGTVGSTGIDMYWFESLPEYAGTVGDFMPRNL